MKDTLASKTVQMALVFAGIGIGCVLSGGEGSSRVFAWRHCLKMLRVHASCVAAEVIPLHLLWRLASENVVSKDVPAIDPVMPVASGRGKVSKPLEAAVCSTGINAPPEALHWAGKRVVSAPVFEPSVVVHPAHSQMRSVLGAVIDFAEAQVLGRWSGVYSLWHRIFLSVSTPRAVTAAPGHLYAFYFSAFVRSAR